MTKQNISYLLFFSSLPLLYFGFSNFEYNSISSAQEAFWISALCTLGIVFFFGSFYVKQYFIDDKKSDTFINVKTKDIIMDIAPKPNNGGFRVVTSVDLMKQEQQLNQRKEQLKQALEEVEQEKLQIQEALQDRGWTRKINGEWTVQ